MTLKVKVDIRGIEKKLGPSNFKNARYATMNQMLLDMQPMIPNRDGILQQTGHISADGSSLIWNTPYAKAQFYGVITNRFGSFHVMQYTTPGTGSRWDKRAKSKYGKDWAGVFVRGLNL